VPLVLVERSGGAGFSGIYFVRFGLRMGEILHFKQIFVTENSNKSQKITF
jgi:hypothetical protein